MVDGPNPWECWCKLVHSLQEAVDALTTGTVEKYGQTEALDFDKADWGKTTKTPLAPLRTETQIPQETPRTEGKTEKSGSLTGSR